MNDRNTGINSDIKKFADNTKIAKVIKSNQDASIVQNDLEFV